MKRKILILGVAVLAAAALWFGMSQSSAPASTIITSSVDGSSNAPGGVVTPGPVDKDTQQILEILLALRAVKLDDSIFSNNAFISLKDFSTQVVPEPVGRPDPFAPLMDASKTQSISSQLDTLKKSQATSTGN
ncbi:hypothetical protein HZC00_00455 [Candidatus Kaiserbacteria bacterium]|nr:hypothetical protein [Candidatus Kaiserbacteria bacterium]